MNNRSDHPTRRLRRPHSVRPLPGRVLAIIAVAASVVLTATVVRATSATAVQIDCSYGGPGLKSYIGDGRDGVTCGGGVSAGNSSSADGSPGGSRGGTASGLCKNPIPPEPFALGGLYKASGTSVSDNHDGYQVVHTSYSRGATGRHVADREILSSSSGVGIWIADYSNYDPTTGGYITRATFSCSDNDGWKVKQEKVGPAPSNPDDDPYPVIDPSGSIALPPTSVKTQSSLTAVPGDKGAFFLRIDSTNTGTIETPMVFDIELSQFMADRMIALPPAGYAPACFIASSAVTEQCTTNDVPPGLSVSFTFVVRARPGASGTLELPIVATEIGYQHADFDGVPPGNYLSSISQFLNPASTV